MASQLPGAIGVLVRRGWRASSSFLSPRSLPTQLPSGRTGRLHPESSADPLPRHRGPHAAVTPSITEKTRPLQRNHPHVGTHPGRTGLRARRGCASWLLQPQQRAHELQRDAAVAHQRHAPAAAQPRRKLLRGLMRGWARPCSSVDALRRFGGLAKLTRAWQRRDSCRHSAPAQAGAGADGHGAQLRVRAGQTYAGQAYAGQTCSRWPSRSVMTAGCAAPGTSSSCTGQRRGR
jgi:hypothetical protein